MQSQIKYNKIINIIVVSFLSNFLLQFSVFTTPNIDFVAVMDCYFDADFFELSMNN